MLGDSPDTSWPGRNTPLGTVGECKGSLEAVMAMLSLDQVVLYSGLLGRLSIWNALEISPLLFNGLTRYLYNL